MRNHLLLTIREFRLITALLFLVPLYLCDANVSVDVLGQVDHVSILRQHHDEPSQSLWVKSVHWIFIFLLFRVLFLIVTLCKIKPKVIITADREAYIKLSFNNSEFMESEKKCFPVPYY